MNVKFSEALSMYSAWKKAESGSAMLSSRDIAAVRKFYKEGAFEKEFARRMAEAKQRKQAGVRVESLKERHARVKSLKERQLLCTPNGTVELEDRRKDHFVGKMTESNSVDNSIITKIREARRLVFKANRLLNENELMDAAAATQQAGAAVNSADAAMGAMGAVPETVVAAVQNVKAAVDELATQCGIESPVDLGADPNAGVPPVNGVADPTMAAGAAPAPAGAPVMEGTTPAENKLEESKKEAEEKCDEAAEAAKEALKDDEKSEKSEKCEDCGKEECECNKEKKEESVDTSDMDAIRERLAKREEALKSMNENFIDDEMASAAAEVKFPNVDKSNSEELVKVSTKKSKDAADTWPTEKISVKETKSASEQMVDAKLNEAENNWSFEKIMKEGILG